MVTVLYSTIQDPGIVEICTTEKSYWDRNRCVDDGGGQHYEDIRAAMEACGAPETSESVFEIEDAGLLPALVAAMAEKGFLLTRSDEFDAFLDGDS